ncbi:MAG: AMP-binding protein, partial [Anaerolineae bacterium]|nr:AMP-binding protein [Anaerolineae bacterium]
MGDSQSIAWSSLGHLLAEAAAIHGDHPLFLYEGERLSYTDFNQHVNRLANVLLELGVGPGDRVSIMLPNGFAFPTAWFALAKLGAVMVPTNTNYVEKDLHYILSDSGAKAIILDAEYVPRVQPVADQLPALEHILVLGDAPAGTINLDDRMAGASESFTIGKVE